MVSATDTRYNYRLYVSAGTSGRNPGRDQDYARTRDEAEELCRKYEQAGYIAFFEPTAPDGPTRY